MLALDYGLAPEMQYPKSLEQCMAVYKWILDGGLGFRAGKISLFGESAGKLHTPPLLPLMPAINSRVVS